MDKNWKRREIWSKVKKSEIKWYKSVNTKYMIIYLYVKKKKDFVCKVTAATEMYINLQHMRIFMPFFCNNVKYRRMIYCRCLEWFRKKIVWAQTCSIRLNGEWQDGWNNRPRASIVYTINSPNDQQIHALCVYRIAIPLKHTHTHIHVYMRCYSLKWIKWNNRHSNTNNKW